jgi:hypothetical protein
VLGAALAVALAIFLIPASAEARSACARSLSKGVVARLCQSGATKASGTRKVTMRATGYWARSKHGILELHGSTPLRTGLSVRVSALRIKGTEIQLLYTHSGGQWLARFSRLKGRGALRGKVVGKWKGKLQVRLRVGHRSIRPTSVTTIVPIPSQLPAPPVSHRIVRTATGGGGCAVPDSTFDSYFEQEGPGWTGGDGTYSTDLPDGRVAWTFGDSYLGNLASDGSRPASSPMVNNAMMVQSGSSFATLVGGSLSQPQSLVSTGESGSWYWPGASAAEGGGLFQFLFKTSRTGPGLWDFKYTGSYLARYSLPGLAVQSVQPVAASDTIQWGVWVLDDSGYTYIYGIEDRGWDKYVHIARVAAGDLAGQWQYYTGSGWSSDPTTSARVLNGASNQYSVVRMNGKYQLVTQAPLGREIYSYSGSSPVGPFAGKTLLYTTPTWGGDSFTYNAVAHPELSGSGQMLISYNVNSSNMADLYSSPELYRPRFVRAGSSCFGS